MGKYINKFEENIDHIPFNPNWVIMANDVLKSICQDFYDDCDYVRTMKSIPIDDHGYIRAIVFYIYGQMYLYFDNVRDNHMECSQLERLIDCDESFTNLVSLVLYSSDPTPEPLANNIMNIFRGQHGGEEWASELNKG